MNGTVQIGCLGGLGRFGNQLFQYACARGYARKVGAQLETNKWIGQTLFKNVNDPPLSKQLPQLPMDVVPLDMQTNFCFYGYFQYSSAFDLYTLSDLREWFTFQDWVHEEMAEYQPPPLVAHLRRGDYLTTYASVFCTIDESAYVSAIKEHVSYVSATKEHVSYGIHVHWVREDKPLVYKRPGMEWLIDFTTMMKAEILFRANSTFSWWAATLGNRKLVYSPIVEGLRGHQTDVKFVVGNAPRCVDLPNVHNYHIKP